MDLARTPFALGPWLELDTQTGDILGTGGGDTGQRFQTGLFGTWMFARKEPAPPIKLYSDIEGGLGWWRDTEYATETPKFIMGGVAPNFSEWANGPGAGKGRDWDKPPGLEAGYVPIVTRQAPKPTKTMASAE